MFRFIKVTDNLNAIHYVVVSHIVDIVVEKGGMVEIRTINKEIRTKTDIDDILVEIHKVLM